MWKRVLEENSKQRHAVEGDMLKNIGIMTQNATNDMKLHPALLNTPAHSIFEHH